MIEKFNFESFEDDKEKKEEILYIEPLNIPFKQIEIPKINKLTTRIDSFKESYISKSLRTFRNLNNSSYRFIIRTINLN